MLFVNPRSKLTATTGQELLMLLFPVMLMIENKHGRKYFPA